MAEPFLKAHSTATALKNFLFLTKIGQAYLKILLYGNKFISIQDVKCFLTNCKNYYQRF